MKIANAGAHRLLVRLDPGDEIINCLEELCGQKGWSNANVHGTGSAENPLLAHYRLDQKKYSQKQLTGIYEITSLIGNVATFEDKTLAHIHVTIADSEMRAFGGHLVEGYCSATCELVVTKLDSHFSKRLDPQIGLKVWDFDKNL